LIVDGYPTIFVGWEIQEKNFLKAKENLKEAIREIDAKKIILDHHIVRDLHYKEKVKDVYELGEQLKKEILTAAEFLELDNFFLEVWRKEIKEGKRKIEVDKYFEELKNKIRKEIETD
jgi:predicted metallo-beta-lactamase superfamily hydrolase